MLQQLLISKSECVIGDTSQLKRNKTSEEKLTSVVTSADFERKYITLTLTDKNKRKLLLFINSHKKF